MRPKAVADHLPERHGRVAQEPGDADLARPDLRRGAAPGRRVRPCATSRASRSAPLFEAPVAEPAQCQIHPALPFRRGITRIPLAQTRCVNVVDWRLARRARSPGRRGRISASAQAASPRPPRLALAATATARGGRWRPGEGSGADSSTARSGSPSPSERSATDSGSTSVRPPSTASTWPVTKPAAGEARNSAAPAQSAGSPRGRAASPRRSPPAGPRSRSAPPRATGSARRRPPAR